MDITVWAQKYDYLSNEMMLNRKDKNEGYYVKKVLNNYYDKIPPLSTIEIETINRCNNTCSFCPVSVGNDKRVYCKMSEELFYKIIDDLVEINYRGAVCLFSNNEPLLDERFFDFLSYVYKKLPDNKRVLFTNGSKITLENFNQLTSMLTHLTINNYDDDLQVQPHLNWLTEQEIDESDCKISLIIRKKTQVLYSRGGNAPNKQNDFTFTSACIIPFIQMVIRPDGKVSLCSYDAYGTETLGDLTKQTITEVWEGQKYQDVRHELISGRASLKMCKKCDMFGFQNLYPDLWVDYYTRALIDKVWEKKEKGKKIYIYSTDNDAFYIKKLLYMHGIFDVEFTSNNDELMKENAFIIFSSYNWEFIETLDPENKLIGNKYIIFQRIKPNWHQFMNNDMINLSECFQKLYIASNSNKLIVFGAGETAKYIIEKLNLNVVYYMDNNAEKQENKHCGKDVIHPHKCEQDNIVLIAISSEEEAHKQLISLGINPQNILSAKRLLNDF